MFRGVEMRKKRISLLVLSALMMMTQVVYAGSKELEDQQVKVRNQRDALTDSVNNKKENMQKAQGKVTSVQKEIDVLDNKIAVITNEIMKIEEQINVLNQKIAKTQLELDEANKNLEAKKEILGNRVKSMYMDGKISYMEVLLNSKDMEELIKNNQTITAIAESDKKLVDYVAKQVDTIEASKVALENDRASFESGKAELAGQRKALQTQINAKNVYMSDLIQDAKAYKVEYDKAQAEWSKLDKEIVNLQKKIKNAKAEEERVRRQAKANSVAHINTSVGQGGLAWPLPGHRRISSPYGNRFHPILKVNRFHSGIDIPAPTGTKVCAAKEGTVIMTKCMGGYGNIVMIDHGDIVTVYAHNSVIKVRTGQHVNQGDVVALVGSTGMSTGPHLHFEVRVNGSTRNPMNYL